MKGAGRFGSVRALTVCTAGDALGDWQSFRHREASMLEEESDGMGVAGVCVAALCVSWDALRRLELAEVHDECSLGDSAGGVGYGCAFSCEDAARGSATEEDSSGAGVLRKYTEGMLRRYVRLSMEAGRAPSLLGREMFRGKVTSYRVHSFEDVVIFVHDVETCLKKLDEGQQHLIRRIALQEFTQAETAGLLGLSLRSVHRQYADALDELTEIFLERKLLEPAKACQEAGSAL